MEYNRTLFSKLCYRYTPNYSYASREHMGYVYSEKIKTDHRKKKLRNSYR